MSDISRPRWVYGAIILAAMGLLFGGIAIGSRLNNSDEKANRALDITKAITAARNASRQETCDALFKLYRVQRNQIARDDVRLQSGAFDKVLPGFSSPQVKRLSHRSALRRISALDNESLPSYCTQRARAMVLPKGFK